MEFFPVIYQAIPGEGHSVFAYMNDGSVRLVDVSGLIERGGVFSRIADKHVFDECLTVMNGTVAWDVSGTRDPSSCIDIDPFTIFSESPVVADPLEVIVA